MWEACVALWYTLLWLLGTAALAVLVAVLIGKGFS